MLVKQAEDVFTVDHTLRLAPGLPFPTRMTVIRLPDASLVLISPVPIGEALAAELAALGPVSCLVGPNRLHHVHLPAAHRRYPEARLLGAPGLEAKHPELRFEPIDPGGAPFGGVLQAQAIEGVPKMSETVLFHAPSRTLIVTDLVFNVEKAPAWTTAAMFWSTGTLGKLAQSRAWGFLMEDAARARQSTARVLGWDFDRLIVAHGSVIDTGARERVGSAVTRGRSGTARA